MSAPLPKTIAALCGAAAVTMTACAADSPERTNVAGPERDAGGATAPRDAGQPADAGTVDAGQQPPHDGGQPRDGGIANMLCPPMGPTGTSVGDVVPDLQLLDCDGNTVSMQSLCERRASHLFIMAGW